jgi:hypothetical protein
MEPSMGDNMVRFTIELPGNIDSRAISDGLTANKLTVAVYDEQGNEIVLDKCPFCGKVPRIVPHDKVY